MGDVQPWFSHQESQPSTNSPTCGNEKCQNLADICKEAFNNPGLGHPVMRWLSDRGVIRTAPTPSNPGTPSSELSGPLLMVIMTMMVMAMIVTMGHGGDGDADDAVDGGG